MNRDCLLSFKHSVNKNDNVIYIELDIFESTR